MIIAVICIIVVLLIIILWAVFTNNSLIAKKNRVKQCRSGICVVLKQRNNLIPNLVASVKAYMGHENEILTRIADLRSRASNATESEQIKSGTEMSSLLSRLNVAVEDYPELKANQQFFRSRSRTWRMSCRQSGAPTMPLLPIITITLKCFRRR